jgi:hypothetical protein
MRDHASEAVDYVEAPKEPTSPPAPARPGVLLGLFVAVQLAWVAALGWAVKKLLT